MRYPDPFQLLLSDLNSRWIRCRQIIGQRTQLADQFLSLLRRIREDEHQQTSVLERMKRMDSADTGLLATGTLDGMIGIEGPDRLRSEVTMIITRLEEQQSRLRDFVDQVGRLLIRLFEEIQVECIRTHFIRLMLFINKFSVKTALEIGQSNVVQTNKFHEFRVGQSNCYFDCPLQ